MKFAKDDVMSKQIFSFLFLFSLSIQSHNPVVQNSPPPKSSEEDQCARYSMQVISPSDAIDYKLRIIKPMEGIDYKLIVINPCKVPESDLAEVVPSKPNNGSLGTRVGAPTSCGL
jgi:hypothetical protein